MAAFVFKIFCLHFCRKWRCVIIFVYHLWFLISQIYVTKPVSRSVGTWKPHEDEATWIRPSEQRPRFSATLHESAPNTEKNQPFHEALIPSCTTKTHINLYSKHTLTQTQEKRTHSRTNRRTKRVMNSLLHLNMKSPLGPDLFCWCAAFVSFLLPVKTSAQCVSVFVILFSLHSCHVLKNKTHTETNKEAESCLHRITACNCGLTVETSNCTVFTRTTLKLVSYINLNTCSWRVPDVFLTCSWRVTEVLYVRTNVLFLLLWTSRTRSASKQMFYCLSVSLWKRQRTWIPLSLSLSLALSPISSVKPWYLWK